MPRVNARCVTGITAHEPSPIKMAVRAVRCVGLAYSTSSTTNAAPEAGM